MDERKKEKSAVSARFDQRRCQAQGKNSNTAILDFSQAWFLTLTFKKVTDRLRSCCRERNSQIQAGAYVEHRDEQYILRGLGQAASLDDLRRSVIRSQGGVPVTVGDVATVQYGGEVRQGAVSRDARGEVRGGGAGLLLRFSGGFAELDAPLAGETPLDEPLRRRVDVTDVLVRDEALERANDLRALVGPGAQLCFGEKGMEDTEIGMSQLQSLRVSRGHA